MHEAALAAPLLKLVLEEIAKQGDPDLTVSRVLVKAGLLLQLEPAQLAGIFEIMAEDTPARGARLVVETEPLRGRCPDCDREVRIDSRRFACPTCGGPRVDWTGGREFYIASITASRTAGDKGLPTPPPNAKQQETPFL